MELTHEPSRLSMTSKVVLGVLLLVNFTVALYLIFAEPSSVRDGVPRSSFPAAQTLTLISDLEPSERVPLSEPGERSFTPAAEGEELLSCQAWGPFANTEVLAPVQALVLEADPAARVVSFEIEAAPDFLVYLDSDNNLDNARRILQELESQGIEAYVIAGGEYINSVSAGVFSNQQGANGLVEQLRDLGYAPELRTLERAQQVTYLLGRVPAEFRAGDAESVECGTIAQLQEFL